MHDRVFIADYLASYFDELEPKEFYRAIFPAGELASHSEIDKYIKQKVDIIVFNLGYLPKSDKSITTNYDTTIKALDSCLNLMSDNGVIAITIYYGHQQGKMEREALLKYLDQIDQKKYMVRYISTLNSDKCPPEVVFITQKGKQIII